MISTPPNLPCEFFEKFYLLSGVGQLMLQLLDPSRQGLFPGLSGRLAAVVPAKVCKTFVAVSVGPELVGEGPDSLVSENLGGDAVLLEDGAHGSSFHQKPVGFALELRREADPPGDDAGDIRVVTQFSEFFCVEFFPGHSVLPFGPDRYEHIIPETDRHGNVHGMGFQENPRLERCVQRSGFR